MMDGAFFQSRRFVQILTMSALLLLAPPTKAEFRTIDGSGNHADYPERGAAGVPLLRFMTNDYADGFEQPAGSDRPGAREISNAVAQELGILINSKSASSYLWQWGQFLDHDLDITESAFPTEQFDIPVPLGDLWFDPDGTGLEVIELSRSEWVLDRFAVRQQTNGVTSWIDASNVYGSDLARAAALVEPDGRLRTSEGDLLPFNTDGLPNQPDDTDPSFFLAGDVRANEQVGLTALHTLFVREHNRLVSKLQTLPEFAGDPATVYQTARAIVGAEMQAITYREFLPVLLGAIPAYSGYQPDLDATIRNFFSTVAFRVGHTMLPSQLQRLDADLQEIPEGHLALSQAFFTPHHIVDHGIEELLRGLVHEPARAIDNAVVDDVRNFLFGQPGDGGFDLAALNIQRARDHGMPSYNQARVDLGLAAVTSFAEISSDPEVQARLASIYPTVDAIDPWVGGLAEDPVAEALVGPLFYESLVAMFRRLRDGDAFWYERALPESWVDYVESMTLAEIVRANTTIGGEIPDDLFLPGLGTN